MIPTLDELHIVTNYRVPQVVLYPNGAAVLAGRELAWDIAHRYDITDPDEADRIALIVAQEVERIGRADARPVMFVMDDGDVSGPLCSWCAVLWPLCGHHKFSEVLDQHEVAP